MAKYRVLAVDDEMSSNKKLFENLFRDDPDFSMDIAESWDEYNKDRLRAFDAILLDVNLDRWDKTLREAFTIAEGECPVMLVSQYWPEPRTHRQISEALAGAKKVNLAGTLALNDLGRDGWEQHAASMRSQLRLVIARHRQQGALALGETDPIRILHLSDSQYGDPGEDNLAFLVEKEIPRFVLGDLKLKIHFIAITGDITYSGQPSEFSAAEEKLRKLVEQFLPNLKDWRDRLLIVPGNHDVDLRLTCADGIQYKFSDPTSIVVTPDSTDISHRRYGLQAFRDFAWRLSGNPHWRDSNDLLWINDSFRYLGVRFYMLNSAAGIDFRNPKNYQVPISALHDLVGNHSLDEGLFGVVLSHHGPIAADNPAREAIENWAQVSKSIQNTSVRMFIHGHGHARLADVVPLMSESKHREANGKLEREEILRIMAPTTHLNGTKRPLAERRGFNLITLKRNYGKVEAVEIDSYELSDDAPHRAKDAPWSVRV